jgi:hypothetical protein
MPISFTSLIDLETSDRLMLSGSRMLKKSALGLLQKNTAAASDLCDPCLLRNHIIIAWVQLISKGIPSVINFEETLETLKD